MKDTTRTGTVAVYAVEATGKTKKFQREVRGDVDLGGGGIHMHRLIHFLTEGGPHVCSCKLQTTNRNHLLGQGIKGSPPKSYETDSNNKHVEKGVGHRSTEFRDKP